MQEMKIRFCETLFCLLEICAMQLIPLIEILGGAVHRQCFLSKRWKRTGTQISQEMTFGKEKFLCRVGDAKSGFDLRRATSTMPPVMRVQIAEYGRATYGFEVWRAASVCSFRAFNARPNLPCRCRKRHYAVTSFSSSISPTSSSSTSSKVTRPIVLPAFCTIAK